MKKIHLSLALTLLSSIFYCPAAVANNVCGDYSTAPQCQTELGPRFLDPQMDPRFNPQVNPRFNPQADPRFNPQADPRFNPKADPRFNPGAKPCDLGIGENCSWYDQPQVIEDETYYEEITPLPIQENPIDQPTASTPSVDVEETDSDSGSIPFRNIILFGLLAGYIFLWDSSLSLKGNLKKQLARFNFFIK